jgi:hypothetical protein
MNYLSRKRKTKKKNKTNKKKVGGDSYIYGTVDNANEQMVINNIPIRLGDALYHPDFNVRIVAFEKILKPLPRQPEDERYTRRYGYTRTFLERVAALAYVDGFEKIRELAYAYYGILKTHYYIQEMKSSIARTNILSNCKSNPGSYNPDEKNVANCVKYMGVSPLVSYSYLTGKYSVSKKGNLSYYGNNVYL